MVCEMCGKDVRTKLMMVEGAPLNLCESCQKFSAGDIVVRTEKGQVVSTPVAERLAKRERRMTARDIYSQQGEKIIADNYGERVRDRRREMNLSQEELAKKINEKKSIIIKVENQDIRPTDKLIATLEKALGISLKEDVEEVDVQSGKEAYSRSLTLGDFIKYE